MTGADAPLVAVFAAYADRIDDLNARRESARVLSRDVTKDSKNTIFLLHRATTGDRDKLLRQGATKLETIRGKIAKWTEYIVSEKEYHQFLYSISPGFQEYVEAEAFLHYLNHGTLVTKDEIQLGLLRCNADLVRISLTTHDYLLGIADLSGEVMRFAVGCASSGNFDGVKHACVFMRKLLAKCEYLSGMGRVKDWPGKVEVMRSSTIKVEIALYKLYLQKLEFPDRPLTLSSDAFERSSDQRESIGCT
ncbi:unnamed protein product (mitochondrion) [Plasmodiophora brassicae]|uniref:Translin n=1 Tax=Plasmodiophora brassicae TaxID=37360 RepID=A0A3P3YHU5_PLABS|nr:unnamed protein product [Plasmodiophora brassicae]